MEWFTCRVQFVNDTDPLAYSNTSFPEPTRPPFHCFNANIPLAIQLPAVHRLLGAPHQVPSLPLYSGSVLPLLPLVVLIYFYFETDVSDIGRIDGYLDIEAITFSPVYFAQIRVGAQLFRR